MKKKGFTLVETIVTIALILTLMIIIIPTTANIVKGSNQKQYEAITNQIKSAAKLYLSDNINIKEQLKTSPFSPVTLSINNDLQFNDYLDGDEEYKDPTDNKKFVSVTITYDEANSELVYVVNKEV